MGEIVGMERLLKIRDSARRSRKRFVFTNGCFDIIHRGHVELLTRARALGDLLVVAINSDESVARLKGSRRPIVGQEDRAAILAALEAVDYVTIFKDDTPGRVIDALRPDVLVKGSDYAPDEIVGKAEVEEVGGRVVRIPLQGEFSTDRMLREIARRYGDTPSSDT
jgi:D-beta-D-heptose 7-phosphate kinase/D-beta-D-heptose 1-phosphate adenosyltransferase